MMRNGSPESTVPPLRAAGWHLAPALACGPAPASVGPLLAPAAWAARHFASAPLRDRRRTARAVTLATQMAAHPGASLAQQIRDPAALDAAYALLNNPAVSLAALLAPTVRETRVLAGQEPLVLFVQDSTELDYTKHPQTRHLGPIGDGKGRGLILHSALAVRPSSRQVLGLAHAQIVLRQPAAATHRPAIRSPEARVWEVAAQEIGPAPPGVVWVHVGDRGSDIFEFLSACLDQGKHALVRACHDRVLAWDPTDPRAQDPTAHTLFAYIRAFPPQPHAGYRVPVAAHLVKGKTVAARAADVAMAWTRVVLPPPEQAPASRCAHAPVEVWVLRVWEPHPPPDVAEPLEWILLSTRPIGTLHDARERVEEYTCRWLCEDYHQCLKTGCRVEESQLDDGEDLCRLLGFAIPLAVRLLQLRQAVRHLPDCPAVALIEPVMVEVLARRLGRDVATLTVSDFWQGVARLGGYLGRKHDGPPGWRTLWHGYLYLADLTDGARLILGSPNARLPPLGASHHTTEETHTRSYEQ